MYKVGHIIKCKLDEFTTDDNYEEVSLYTKDKYYKIIKFDGLSIRLTSEIENYVTFVFDDMSYLRNFNKFFYSETELRKLKLCTIK